MTLANGHHDSEVEEEVEKRTPQEGDEKEYEEDESVVDEDDEEADLEEVDGDHGGEELHVLEPGLALRVPPGLVTGREPLGSSSSSSSSPSSSSSL